jgi:hypothetical protein
MVVNEATAVEILLVAPLPFVELVEILGGEGNAMNFEKLSS